MRQSEYGGKPNWASVSRYQSAKRGGDPTLDYFPRGGRFQSKCDQVKSFVLEKKRGSVASVAKGTGLQPKEIYGCLETLVIQNLITTDDAGNWRLLPGKKK